MSNYPEITAELVADPHADDCAIYDAAKGDEDAQLWLARLYLATSEAAPSQSIRISTAIGAVAFSCLAATHGKVEAVSVYRDCLAHHRAIVEYPSEVASSQDQLIARLNEAIEGRAGTDRVKVRV